MRNKPTCLKAAFVSDRMQYMARREIQDYAISCIYLLLSRLSFTEGCGHRGTRLGDVELLLRILYRIDQALVLVTPYHKIQKVIQKCLGYVIGLAVWRSRHTKERRSVQLGLRGQMHAIW